MVADFSHPDNLHEALDGHFSDASKISILVNNTGGPAGGPIIDAHREEFRITFNTHLICNHILAQKVVPMMKNEGYGRIINVISTSVGEIFLTNTLNADGGWKPPPPGSTVSSALVAAGDALAPSSGEPI